MLSRMIEYPLIASFLHLVCLDSGASLKPSASAGCDSNDQFIRTVWRRAGGRPGITRVNPFLRSGNLIAFYHYDPFATQITLLYIIF